ncbi:uncharacterized protein A4U43_C09F2980 [Asparagus officinalis]|uniref:RRM domain-containing protein n=1 Tax=Asparagus officinalis TaxID=4686 RepID=A0A5P1E4X5_ASPOF|nr:uncharacterized protein A4U43_C09F2980 [Asparagus officinalis]
MAKPGRGRSPSVSGSGSSSRSRSSSRSDSRSRSRSLSRSRSKSFTSSSSPSRSGSSRSRSPPPQRRSPIGAVRRARSPSPAPKRASPPRKKSPVVESGVLCIEYLSRNVNEGHLKEIFNNFGEVVNAELAMNRNVNLPLGHGYVTFKKRADAEKARLYMDGGQIDGTVVGVKFTLPQRPRVSPPPKAVPVAPKREAPPRDKVGIDVEKETQQRPRDPSPRRKPASPSRRRSPIRRAPSPRRRPDSPPPRRAISPARRRADSPPYRRGGSPPRRRGPSPARRGSPSPPPRRYRSPARVSPRRVRGSPIRKRSPLPLRRRSPPPRRARSPPRRSPPPRRRSRSPIRRLGRSRSRSMSPRRGRAPPRRGRSSSSFSDSPSPPRKVEECQEVELLLEGPEGEETAVSVAAAAALLLNPNHFSMVCARRLVSCFSPRVVFCGYSIPHPSDNRVNIRVQTTGDSAKDVFKDSLQNLMFICQHVRTTFDKSVADFKVSQPLEQMNIDKR